MGSIDEQFSKKRYCLWALIVVLTITSLSNLLLGITVMAVLRVNRGMESMEVLPEENLIKLFGRTDLDVVSLQRGVCEGFGDEPLEVSAEEAGVSIAVRTRPRYGSSDSAGSKVEVLADGTTISSARSFEVKDPSTGSTYFSADNPIFELTNGVERIDLRIAESRRIVAPINSSLTLTAESRVSMQGAEGIEVDAKEVLMAASEELSLKSVNGSIVLHANGGIFIDLERIPLVTTSPSGSSTAAQYKLCVCMPQGRLFRLPVAKDLDNRSANCARVNRSPDNDPCAR